MTASELAGFIDHTLLRPDATPADIVQLCAEAAQHGFFSVCVNPLFTPLAARRLTGTAVKVCSVIGFPLGATASACKADETAWTVAQGAGEIDMVLAVGLLKAGDHDAVLADIAAVRRACGPALLKVIIEAVLLDDNQKRIACQLSRAAGADFVKTSTGFAGGGATTGDVALMRQAVGPNMGVKASGGIRDRATALAMIDAGADRIGASASVKIVSEARGP